MVKQLAVSMILLLMPYSACAETQMDISGAWEADAMGSHVVASVSQNDTAISGVAYVTNSSGKRFTNKFSGSINNDRINVSIAGGFSFSGNVTSKNSVSGVVWTKDGHQVPVNASRR